MDPFLGEIRIFPGNFAPKGWALCNGQVMPVSQNTALFSLLGFTYGGNGQTTFALPDLGGRVPIHAGQGPGLSSRSLGQTGGQVSVTVALTQMAGHSHTAQASSNAGTQSTPAGNVWAAGVGRRGQAFYAGTPGTSPVMSAATLGSAGGGQAHNNLPPYLTLNFIIALAGVFPARS
jgi:microcystin-dependent protein